MTEIWRVIDGFDGAYEVSDLGRVRRAFGAAGVGTSAIPGKILTARKDCNGYPRALLYDRVNKKYRSVGVHTAVLEAFVGPRPDGTEASHLNGTRSDNRLTNLAWETRSQNHLRKREHGTMHRGELHHKTKLNIAQVREIRRRVSHETHEQIARSFGVTRECVSSIVRRESWAHV